MMTEWLPVYCESQSLQFGPEAFISGSPCKLQKVAFPLVSPIFPQKINEIMRLHMSKESINFFFIYLLKSVLRFCVRMLAYGGQRTASGIVFTSCLISERDSLFLL